MIFEAFISFIQFINIKSNFRHLMTDLAQIFLTKQPDAKKKERKIPTLFATQKKVEKSTNSTYAFNKQQSGKTLDLKTMNLLQKNSNMELKSCRIGQDLKKSISRYSMEEELKIYQRKYIQQLIIKSVIIVVLISVSFLSGIISFKIAIQFVLFLIFLIAVRENLLTNSALSNYLSNKTPWLIKVFNFWFLVCVGSLICAIYYDFTFFIMSKMEQRYLVSGYLVFNFAVFNTLCYFILYYYLHILKQLATIQSNKALQSGYFKNLRYAFWYIIHMVFGLKHIKLILALQVTFYLLLCGWALFNSVGLLISQIFNFYFIASQIIAFIFVFFAMLAIILIIDQPICFLYKIKVSKIHLFVSLLKLQSIPNNDQIHFRCLNILEQTVENSYSFMDNEINNSIYYRSYWDIYQQFLKEYLHRVCISLCNLQQQIKIHQNILKNKKTIFNNPFILLRKWNALTQLEVKALLAVNLMQSNLKIYSIILYGKIQAYNSTFHLNIAVKNSLNQIFHRIQDLSRNYSEYLSQATQIGLENHVQQLRIFLQDTSIKNQPRYSSIRASKQQ